MAAHTNMTGEWVEQTRASHQRALDALAAERADPEPGPRVSPEWPQRRFDTEKFLTGWGLVQREAEQAALRDERRAALELEDFELEPDR